MAKTTTTNKSISMFTVASNLNALQRHFYYQSQPTYTDKEGNEVKRDKAAVEYNQKHLGYVEEIISYMEAN